jgi:hypothetical protein
LTIVAVNSRLLACETDRFRQTTSIVYLNLIDELRSYQSKQEFMENVIILERATTFIIARNVSKPSSTEIVSTLLQAEKNAKQEKKRYALSQLIGNWRLCFITGTKKTRQSAGIVLGAGRYLPGAVKIYLSYDRDRVSNTVKFGFLQFSLTGPIKFLEGKNILAFDFTQMTVKLFGTQLYQGNIRGGKSAEEKFHQESVGKQPFFAYFLVTENIIAARGRGGGLALWGKVKE